LSAANVPGRGEYMARCTTSNSISSSMWRVFMKASSDSPGKPTITSVTSPISGIRVRAFSTIAR